MAREREARAHSFQEERAVIEERRALLEWEEELRTRDIEATQRALEAERETAEQDVTSAKGELERQQQLWEARQKTIDDYITALGNERRERAWTDSEAERLKNQEIGRMETTLKTTQESYKDRRTEINDYIGKLEDEEKAEAATAKTAVQSAKDKVDALNTAISEARFDEKQVDTWNKLADGFDKAAKAVGEGSPQFAEFTKQAEAARLKAAELASGLNDDLPRAIGAAAPALVTAADDFGKVYGPADRPGTMANQLFDKDVGFFPKLAERSNIALEQLRIDIYASHLDALSNTIKTKFTEMKDPVEDSASGLGMAMDQGVARGIDEGTYLIEEAARRAVQAGIDAGKDQIESGSPSRRTARELGGPMGQGIAIGVLAEERRIAEAMSGMLDRVFAQADRKRAERGEYQRQRERELSAVGAYDGGGYERAGMGRGAGFSASTRAYALRT